MDVRYSEMFSIASALEEFKKKHNFDAAIKKATFFKFWSKVVGKKFQEVSKPVSINSNGVLQVACKNSLVTGELFMFKDDILKKMQPYTAPLKLEITDIVFSHKIWTEEQQEENLVQEAQPEPQKISDEELDKIELDEETLEEVRLAVENSKFASDEQKKKMYCAIIKNLKEQKHKKMES